MSAAWRPSTMPQGRSVSSLGPDRPAISTAWPGWSPACCWTCRTAASSPPGWPAIAPDRNALLKTHKEVGTVAEAFRLNHRDEFEAIMQGMDGPAAIGHVRYATCGGNDRYDAQPFERDHGRKAKWFAFAFNGQLANYQSSRTSCSPRATTT